MRRGGSSSSSEKGEGKLLQELLLYAASTALSCLVLFVGLRHLDSNRDSSKKALQHKKDIAKRLGRPLFLTNSYEEPRLLSQLDLEKAFERK